MPSIDSLSIRISASTGDAATKVKNLTQAVSELAQAIDSLDVGKFDSLSKAVDSLASGLSEIKGTSVKHIKAVGNAINSANESAKKGSMKAVAKDVEKVSDASKKASDSVEKVNTNLAGTSATSLESVANVAEKVSTSFRKTSEEMGLFKKTLAKLKIIIPTEGLEKTEKKIKTLQDRVADLKDKIDFKSKTVDGYIDGKDIEKDKEKLDGLINELERLKLKKQELESHGGFKLNLGTGLDNLKKGFDSVNKKLDGFISKMHRAKSQTRDTSKATKDFGVASMKLAKELTRVTKMLKLMITRMVLRKVIQGVIDGFKNLTQYSSEVDASVSLMWNSFRQLGNAIAAAVGPLINALAPALNYIIQLCIKVANAINQVISALLGRSTWTRAKTLTDDYAKSLDKSNKSAKELKKTVLGFDELNQLQDNKDSGSGGGMTKPEDMFEDAKIESKWANLAQKLRKILNQLLAPIKKAWAKVGDQVVAAWKGAFESIKKLLEDIGRDFLKVWNQPQTVKMLENILKIFRDIGNIVKNLADGLDKAWNKNQTGLHILEAIRDVFAIIIQHVQNMTEATADWAKNLDFSPLLNAFKEWVESMAPVVDAIAGAFEDFYTKVLLPLGDWALTEGLPDLINVFTELNERIDWEKIRERLNKVWDALEPFAQTVGEGLVIFIGDISETLAGFVNSDKWDDFVDTLVKFMKDVDADEIASQLHIILDAFLAFKGLSFLVGTVTAIKGFVAAIGSLTETLGIFSGVLATLVAFFIGADIGKIIMMHVLPDDKEIYRKYMGIIGTIRMLRDNVIAEKDAIIMTWENFWDHITSKAKENFRLIGMDIEAFIKKIKDVFSTDNWFFSGVADGLKKTFEAAKKAIAPVWNSIADKLNGQHKIGFTTFEIKLPKFYAKGGFPDPEDGWFRASHGEMLGKFDNGQSVVANNEQITNGIAKAVYSALMSANSGNGSTRYINNTIQIDGRTIARAVTMGQDDMNRRYSPVTT